MTAILALPDARECNQSLAQDPPQASVKDSLQLPPPAYLSITHLCPFGCLATLPCRMASSPRTARFLGLLARSCKGGKKIKKQKVASEPQCNPQPHPCKGLPAKPHEQFVRLCSCTSNTNFKVYTVPPERLCHSGQLCCHPKQHLPHSLHICLGRTTGSLASHSAREYHISPSRAFSWPGLASSVWQTRDCYTTVLTICLPGLGPCPAPGCWAGIRRKRAEKVSEGNDGSRGRWQCRASKRQMEELKSPCGGG